jgi:hypothetical protein
MQMRITRFGLGIATTLLLAGMGLAQNSSAAPHCQPISGTVMTNLAIVDQNTSLGVVDGALKGARPSPASPRRFPCPS